MKRHLQRSDQGRYLLSNTNDIHWQFIRRRYPHVLEPFDPLLVSHELGMEKPDAAVYAWVIRHSGHRPEEHLFIDDLAVERRGCSRGRHGRPRAHQEPVARVR